MVIRVGEREIGPGLAPFVIAELGANHAGSLDRALRLVEAAAAAGADAIKLQTYTADSITMDSSDPAFQVSEPGSLWEGRTLHDVYSEGATPLPWHGAIFDRARELGLLAFSTPFSPESVADLEMLGVPLYKVASLENNHVPLLQAVARTGKPVLVSTGASTVEEVDFCVEVLRKAGCRQLVVLQCTTAYPARADQANLCAMQSWERRYGCIAGVSDHTLDAVVPVAAAAMGAAVIEKHMTLSREDGALDSRFAMEPDAFARMVRDVRTAWLARGDESLSFANESQPGRRYRRSIFLAADVRPGDAVSPANTRIVRPAGGLPPAAWDRIQGKRFSVAGRRAEPLRDEMLEP
ncbi:MAG: pseudaminic acid synthase [Thermoplasmatota archaeon]